MSDIKAIVFDMDGVLIDSREMITRAIEDVLAAHGLTVTKETVAAVTGKPVRAMYEVFAPGYDPDELEAAHLAHHEENPHLLQEYDGVDEALTALKPLYRLGIFTGFNELSRDRLDRFDLLPFFSSIVDTTRYTAHKPDPEGLLLCLSELGVQPDEAVYVGDGIGDMVAGHAAGVKAVVGITQGFGSEADLREAGADYIIHSLLELPELVKSL